MAATFVLSTDQNEMSDPYASYQVSVPMMIWQSGSRWEDF